MAIKCYTRKKNNGGNYTNCVDDKGRQMREKDKKKVVKKKSVKRKKLVILNKPKAENIITVVSGAPGTTTTFKATKPRTKRAPVGMTRVGGPTGNEGAMVVNPISMEEELDLMPQNDLNAQMTNVRNLVANAKALRKPKPAKMRTVEVGKAADDKIKKMLGNVSETKSALTSSAKFERESARITNRQLMREKMKPRLAAKKRAQRTNNIPPPRAAMSEYDQDELMAELMS